MKNYTSILLLFFGLLFSCKESEEPSIETEVELEQFERHDHFLFNFGYSDVQRIKVIGDRMLFSNKTNPGYMDNSGEIIQLCCSRNNNMDLRQSLSSQYIVAADQSLNVYNIYDVNESRSSSLFLDRLISHENYVRVNPSVSLSNFEMNEDHLISSLIVDGVNGIYIFDFEKHFSLFGTVESGNDVIKVDIPTSSQNFGPTFYKVDAFEDGWIASINNIDFSSNGTYFIDKAGRAELLYSQDDLSYFGHAFTSEGQLLLGGFRELRVSSDQSRDNFYFIITSFNNFKFRLIQDRLVIWNPNFAEFYEVEGYKADEELVVRRLNNEGVEFTKLNDIAEFNGKVYLATTQGLFSKSLEGFWDSFPEQDGVIAVDDFMEGLEMRKF